MRYQAVLLLSVPVELPVCSVTCIERKETKMINTTSDCVPLSQRVIILFYDSKGECGPDVMQAPNLHDCLLDLV